MAERKDTRILPAVREKIRAGMLADRLEKHALGTLDPEMSNSQVRAAEILLRKCVPDLASIQHTGEDGGPLRVIISKDDAGLL